MTTEERAEQNRINDYIVNYANTLAVGIGMTRQDIERALDQGREEKKIGYCCMGNYLHQRLDRLAKNGRLRKLIVKGKAYYYGTASIPAAFDVSVETDRLVAADFVQEKGDESTAEKLRKAVRGK